MARKKAGDNQAETSATGSAEEVKPTSNVQADHGSTAIGEISIGGDLSGSFTVGYTAEQVSLLLTQITSNYQRKPFDGRCPYKGLEVFEEEDAALFFGRERLVEDLLSRVKESRTVFITGPSGSGKSSLVRAGLIHALKGGNIPGSERWLYETMKPGREPLKELSLAFSRLKGPDLADYFQAHGAESDVLHKCAESVLSGNKDQRFLFFVDQFEEVFTQINGEEERLAFINMLAHAGTVENGRVIVLFAMRSDFVSNCATYPMLNELLSKQFRQIGAMQPDELVAAIALPARHVGLPIQDELIARIINDMKGEPGALPLMQFALKDLFDSHQEKGGVIALTLDDYLRHGGIQKSLERHADASLAALDEEGQALARSIFSGLIEIGRGTQDTKRTALFDELVPANASTDNVLAIVQKLADARLIITDEQAGKDTVTISHEKLIDAWPWLKKLVNENRDVIALQNEIGNDAKEWDDHQRESSYLYTGARLVNAREKIETNKIVLSGLAQLYIETGVKAYADELEIAKQRANQLRLRAIYLSLALLGTLIAICVAVIFSFQSRQQAKIAFARQLAAQSIVQRSNNLDLSFLLSLETQKHAQIAGIPVEGNVAILGALTNSPRLVAFLNGNRGEVYSVAFSPDGKTLASGVQDGTIILWDVSSGEQLAILSPAGYVGSMAFSPDGKILASGGTSGTALWDVASGKQLFILQDTYIVSVAFSPNGQILASIDRNGSTLWSISDRKVIGKPISGRFDSQAFSPDGKTLATGDVLGTISLWDINSQQQLGTSFIGHNSHIYTLAFSPDGKTLASGSWDKTIILWDVASRSPLGAPLIGHTKEVHSVVFSPDGKTLASSGIDKDIILWDVISGRALGSPLTGHTDSITGLAFSPDGYILAASSSDTSISLWDLDRSQRLGELLSRHTDTVYSVTFSPHGKILASGSWDKSVILWDATMGKLMSKPIPINAGSNTVAFSPDGKVLAFSNAGDNIVLWDVDAGRELGELFVTSETFSVYNIVFSPDGKTLAASSGNKIYLWDIVSQKQLVSPLIAASNETFICCPAVGVALAFSPNGKVLASGPGYNDSSIILWDMGNYQQIGTPLSGHTGPIYSVAFSPDGKILASGSYDKTVILWDVARHQLVGTRLIGHAGPIYSVAFSPDGKTLASGSGDNSIILWSLVSQKPIGAALTGPMGTVYSVTFSPDGKTLASGGEDTYIILWDIDPESWKKRACQIAGRNFTRAEWAEYFPDEAYPTEQEDATCPEWPLAPAILTTPSPAP